MIFFSILSVIDHLGFAIEPSSFSSRFIIGKRQYNNTYEVLFRHLVRKRWLS